MRRILLALLLAAGIAVSAAPAAADVTCAAGSTCTVYLTQSNVTQLAGVQVTVTINNTGPNTIISFQLTNNPLSNPALGFDHIGWNGTVGSSSSVNYGGNQITTGFSSSLDGFGKFTAQGQDPGGNGGISSPISFTLAGLVTTFSENSVGNEFAVHIRFGGDCSGWIGGDFGSRDPGSLPACTPGTSVPEPASMALFGSGLLGLAGVIRRRLRG